MVVMTSFSIKNDEGNFKLDGVQKPVVHTHGILCPDHVPFVAGRQRTGQDPSGFSELIFL